MNILLISDNRFPDGDAGAVRERVFATMLQKDNHKIFRVGRFCTDIDKISDIGCYPVTDKGKFANGNLANLLLFNHRVKKSVVKAIQANKIDAFLITGCKGRLVTWLKSVGKRNNIKLIYNSVEYYSSNQFRYGTLDRQYITNHFIANHILNDGFRVIAISSFLENKFRETGIKQVARIPFILYSSDIPVNESSNEIVEIAYAGRPGRSKDYVKEFVESLLYLSKEELKRIRLTLVGISEKQLNERFEVSYETIKTLGNSLSVRGLLPRNEALSIVSNADFTILYRSNTEDYAKAGFPTKVTESLMSGIPVITNLTSDLAVYLSDGINGFIIDENNSITDCYRKAISLTKSELRQMKSNARKTAEEKLDASGYETILAKLFAE